MITRRTFHLAAAGAAGAMVALTGRTARAADRVVFTAYGMRYDWHPIKALGDWPLDHIAVATSAGTQWGCFGRTYAQNRDVSHVIASGTGDELWARAIAGPDGSAGIENGINGVCDHCANRILLPAGFDVRNSVGNEIAILFCGIYGFGTAALVTRIKEAAAAVNKDHPGRVREQDVDDAVKRVSGGLDEEWQIVRGNTERIIEPALGAARYAELKSDIEAVYLSFYYRRTALFHAFERHNLDKGALVARMRDAFSASLADLKDVVGAGDYAKIVPVPPSGAGEYLARKTKDERL